MRVAAVVAGTLALFACTEMSAPTLEPRFVPGTTPLDTVQVVAAGDIAGCNANYKDEATAALVARFPTALVLPLGDNIYTQDPRGSYACFHASWGAFKSRMAPASGNHEYLIPGAAAYFDYFNGVGVDSGMAGHRARGYYSFDYGGWRIYVLNSEQQFIEQAAWIRADAQASPRQCQLAVMHKPFYSSAVNPRTSKALLRPIFEALLATQVDVLLSGHVHSYERFFPQNSLAGASTLSGIRQFVVGTGGGPLDVSPFAVQPKPNSERRIANTYGILHLKLSPPSQKTFGKYDFSFISIAGARLDAGARPCR